MFSNAFKVIVAGIGFVGGFFWSVSRWSGATDISYSTLFASNSAIILLATIAYCLVIASLFDLRGKRKRFSVDFLAPLSFFGSFLVGATGIRMALWLVV